MVVLEVSRGAIRHASIGPEGPVTVHGIAVGDTYDLSSIHFLAGTPDQRNGLAR